MTIEQRRRWTKIGAAILALASSPFVISALKSADGRYVHAVEYREDRYRDSTRIAYEQGMLRGQVEAIQRQLDDMNRRDAAMCRVVLPEPQRQICQ